MGKSTRDITEENNIRCSVCGLVALQKTCIECKAIVSARRVFKSNFVYRKDKEREYMAKVIYNDNIRPEEKPAEISKIMNSFTVVKKIKDYERDSKARETNIGMDGLNLEERQKFFTVYHGHYKRLEDNQEYAMKKIGYDSERRVFFIKDMDFYNQLKFENQVKDNARIN